jgi:Ca2+-binding EF-hand superfamily protein
MKRTFLILALVVGLALGLCVAVGVAWYFMREPNAGPAAIRDGTPETEPIDAVTVGGGETTGGNNARAAKFAELDLDKDGRLSLTEFSGARKPAEAAKWFERRDVNRDGFLSREEFLPFSAKPKTP